MATTTAPIDTHCHLEQHDYDNDRAEVIEECRKKLKALITCAPDPGDYDSEFEMVRSHPGFVFAIAGIHPEYTSKYDDKQIGAAMSRIRENRGLLVGIGETGLDYSFITDPAGRERQRDVFARFVRLAKDLDLPVVVHLRNGQDREEADVFVDAFEILKREDAKKVHLHMFGSRQHVEEAATRGWMMSVNAIVMASKTYGKVARDIPLDRLLLETDSPWLHPSLDKGRRNDPTHVREVAEKVAEIKKVAIENVIDATTENAMRFFNLKV